MCGILGIFSKLKTNNIFYDLFEGLYHLQHRGQDSYGIAVLQNNQKYNIIKHKNPSIKWLYWFRTCSLSNKW